MRGPRPKSTLGASVAPPKGASLTKLQPDRELHVATFDRITTDPRRMNGQPCVRGLRLTVRRVLEALALYPDRAELLREYPELEAEDIRQVLAYAATALDDKVLDLPKSA